jgi:RimJ/RimL family protein N-acetyltransferase
MESVYLRALELDDLERTHRWHNDPILYETLVGPFRYVSRATEEDWLRRKVASPDQEINLAICLTADSTHIGNVYMRNIDWLARHAEVSMFLGEPEQRSKGYGTAALRLLIRHAFRDLGLSRLYAFILEENTASLRMCEKCGFVLEGKLRQHAYKNGEFRDLLVVGVCSVAREQG